MKTGKQSLPVFLPFPYRLILHAASHCSGHQDHRSPLPTGHREPVIPLNLNPASFVAQIAHLGRPLPTMVAVLDEILPWDSRVTVDPRVTVAQKHLYCIKNLHWGGKNENSLDE